MRLCLPALRLPGGILSGLQVMGSAASSATRWTQYNSARHGKNGNLHHLARSEG